MRDILNSVLDFLADVRNFVERLLDHIVTRFKSWWPTSKQVFGYGNYTHPWHWDAQLKRWVYGPSVDISDGNNKSYNCAEYVIARIESRAPQWGGADESVTTETHETIAALEARGWVQHIGGCNCGCGPDQNKNCVVVFREQEKQVSHVVILDHVRCDWGAKLGPGLPIARCEKPEDYLGTFVPADCEMLYFCPRPSSPDVRVVKPAPGGQVTDEWMHANARKLP